MTDASRYVTWATILGSPGIRKLTRGFSLLAPAGRALLHRGATEDLSDAPSPEHDNLCNHVMLLR